MHDASMSPIPSAISPIPSARRQRGHAALLLIPILLTIVAVGLDQGEILRALGAGQTEWLHEFFHDGRHLFGFPCH